jgi:hypothetical protein
MIVSQGKDLFQKYDKKPFPIAKLNIMGHLEAMLMEIGTGNRK